MKPALRGGRHEAKRTQKPRQRAPVGRNDWLFQLLNDDSPCFAALRKQAQAELVDVIDAAEARLEKLIRASFRAIDGGRR